MLKRIILSCKRDGPALSFLGAAIVDHLAVILICFAAVVVVAALMLDGSDLGPQLVADISRGDIIALASQH